MFVPNFYILTRMGWTNLNTYWFDFPDYLDKKEDKYYIEFNNRKKSYVIKQKNIDGYNEYKFAIIDFSKKKVKLVSEQIIKSNIELLSLVRENLACDLEYQRFFQINSIIK